MSKQTVQLTAALDVEQRRELQDYVKNSGKPAARAYTALVIEGLHAIAKTAMAPERKKVKKKTRKAQ